MLHICACESDLSLSDRLCNPNSRLKSTFVVVTMQCEQWFCHTNIGVIFSVA